MSTTHQKCRRSDWCPWAWNRLDDQLAFGFIRHLGGKYHNLRPRNLALSLPLLPLLRLSVGEDPEEVEEEELQNQHAIAIAVEPITFTNRLPVRPKQKFAACKRADQHQQSRARQVKICQQTIDRSETVRWVN